MEDLPKILHQVFLRSPKNLFDEFVLECQKWFSQPAHSLVELRKRDNKKIRGEPLPYCILNLLMFILYIIIYYFILLIYEYIIYYKTNIY